jgi:hypothetical protein
MADTREIRDGKPYIHCILGREGDTTLAGHLTGRASKLGSSTFTS